MKNILITGASSGLGKSLFFKLKKKYPKANFYLVSRNPYLKVIENKNSQSKVIFCKFDLSERKCVKKIIKIIGQINFDLLINNAGQIYNSNNFQKNLNLNTLSHFYLNYYFIKKKRNNKIKIINISSFYHSYIKCDKKNLTNIIKRKTMFSLKAYALSKLFSLALSKNLESKFPNKCIFFNINPGLIISNFDKKSFILKKLISKFIRYFIGRNPDDISKEIVKIISKNPYLTRSKLLYNKFNHLNKLVDDKEFQKKIFHIANKIYKNI